MTVSQQSVGKFCSITTATLASLALLDAANLGNGAQVYVIATGRSYRFFAGSSLTSMSPVVIVDSGAAGAWVQENAVNDQTFFIESVNTSGIRLSTLNVWAALPAANTYAQDSAKACWSCSAAGVVTYNGPPATFQVTASFSGTGNVTTPQTTWEFDLTRNGAVIGSTTSFNTSTQTTQDTFGNIFCSHISPPIFITPAGTTYQHVVRNLTGTRSFSLIKYQACFQLLPDR